MNRHVRWVALVSIAAPLATTIGALGGVTTPGRAFGTTQAASVSAGLAATDPSSYGGPAASSVPRGRTVLTRPRPPVSIPRAGRVIQLRPWDVRLLVNGTLVAQRYRPRGTVTLSQLHRLTRRPDWLSISGRVATLRAAIYQAPGTALNITSADVHTLRLQQDSTGYGGVIEGTGARVTIDGVLVVGWDGARRRAASEGPLRPYLEYHRRSQLDLRNARFAYLGRPVRLREGVSVFDGAALRVSGSSFSHNRLGLLAVRTGTIRLDRVSAVANTTHGVMVRDSPAPQLRRVSVSGNRGFGLAVDGSSRPVLTSVKAEGNRGVGVTVRNARSVALSSINTTANGSDGLQVVAASGGLLSNVVAGRNQRAGLEVLNSNRISMRQIRTSVNHGPGVDIVSSSALRLAGLVSTADVVGLLARFGSNDLVIGGVTVSRSGTGVALQGQRIHATKLSVDQTTTALALGRAGVTQVIDGLQVTRSAVGVQVAAGNRNSTLRGVEVHDPANVGLDLQGMRTHLQRVTVRGGRTAILIRGSAIGTTLDGISAHGVQTAVVIQSQVGDVTIGGLNVDQAVLGVDSGARHTVIDGARMTGVGTGVKVRRDAVLLGVNIDAQECAVRTVDTTPRMSGGTLRARRALCGPAELEETDILAPATPNGYGVFAGAMVVLAVGYELVRRARERPRRPLARSAVSKGARA